MTYNAKKNLIDAIILLKYETTCIFIMSQYDCTDPANKERHSYINVAIQTSTIPDPKSIHFNQLLYN